MLKMYPRDPFDAANSSCNFSFLQLFSFANLSCNFSLLRMRCKIVTKIDLVTVYFLELGSVVTLQSKRLDVLVRFVNLRFLQARAAASICPNFCCLPSFWQTSEGII